MEEWKAGNGEAEGNNGIMECWNNGNGRQVKGNVGNREKTE